MHHHCGKCVPGPQSGKEGRGSAKCKHGPRGLGVVVQPSTPLQALGRDESGCDCPPPAGQPRMGCTWCLQGVTGGTFKWLWSCFCTHRGAKKQEMTNNCNLHQLSDLPRFFLLKSSPPNPWRMAPLARERRATEPGSNCGGRVRTRHGGNPDGNPSGRAC